MNSFKILFTPLGLALLALVFITLTWSMVLPWYSVYSSGIRADEEVIFLPTSGARNEGGSWSLPIHSWIFEREEGDILRTVGRKLIGELVEQFGVPEQETHSQIFKDRIGYFLVDNQRGKQPKVTISSLKHSLPVEAILVKSAANGHALTQFRYEGGDKDGSWLTLAIKMPAGDQRNFMGQIKLVPPMGLSVICDIDDTIKVSDVLNKRELIRNSLFRPFKPVRSMSRHLRELEQKGAYFHYVSASPWQMYPSLKQFLDNYVPRGSVSLRNFRLKDKSFHEFLQPGTKFKINTIRAILKRYPKHRFMLIGDSGEHDPETYGEIYRAFPEQISNITIRRIEGSDVREQRFADAFKDIPETVWSVRRFVAEEEK